MHEECLETIDISTIQTWRLYDRSMQQQHLGWRRGGERESTLLQLAYLSLLEEEAPSLCPHSQTVPTRYLLVHHPLHSSPQSAKAVQKVLCIRNPSTQWKISTRCTHFKRKIKGITPVFVNTSIIYEGSLPFASMTYCLNQEVNFSITHKVVRLTQWPRSDLVDNTVGNTSMALWRMQPPPLARQRWVPTSVGLVLSFFLYSLGISNEDFNFFL